MFIDKLINDIIKKDNPTVIGLDPKLEYIPKFLLEKMFSEYGPTMSGAAQAILKFNIGIIDETFDMVPCIKPQSAYYEMYGHDGVEVLANTIEYAKSRGMMIILDGKRNDIGSTADAYATAYLGETFIRDSISQRAFLADALTVNGYIGIDGIEPFLKHCNQGEKEKGIFVLVKTSNPSSGQLQDLCMENGETVYEIMANLVNEWGGDNIGEYGYTNIGAVVGATFPEQAEQVRNIISKSYILVPGYGAQGGTADGAAKSFNKDGLGAIVNASRSIMCAYKDSKWKDKFRPEEFGKAARAEAMRMKDELNSAISKRQ